MCIMHITLAKLMHKILVAFPSNVVLPNRLKISFDASFK